jgi:hypothetical protein
VVEERGAEELWLEEVGEMPEGEGLLASSPKLGALTSPD